MRECLFPRPLKCPCQGSVLWNQWNEVRECLKEPCKMLVVTTSEQLRSPDFKLRAPSLAMKRMLVDWTKLLLLLFTASEFSRCPMAPCPCKMKETVSCSVTFDTVTPWTVTCQASLELPRVAQAMILEAVAILFSRISSTQGSNLGLLHCRQILYLWATRVGRTIKQRG